MITIGSIVRFRVEMDPGDREARFVVTEDNGDRVLIRLICDLPIPPTQVVLREDLVEA